MSSARQRPSFIDFAPCPPCPRPRQQRGPPPNRCPPGCVPAPFRCPPGCVPAPPRKVCYERLYFCRPIEQSSPISPNLNAIINRQLAKIQRHQQQQNQPSPIPSLTRTQSSIAIPQSTNSRVSGYAISQATSISASVDELPAAIKQVLQVADNVVPRGGNVTYINSRPRLPKQCPVPLACPQRCCTPPPCCQPPAPKRRLRRCKSYRCQPVCVAAPLRCYSPYEVLPVIHVRCDPCADRKRRLDIDNLKKSQQKPKAETTNCNDIMEIEIEISNP